jgi:hypothetical protein
MGPVPDGEGGGIAEHLFRLLGKTAFILHIVGNTRFDLGGTLAVDSVSVEARRFGFLSSAAGRFHSHGRPS